MPGWTSIISQCRCGSITCETPMTVSLLKRQTKSSVSRTFDMTRSSTYGPRLFGSVPRQAKKSIGRSTRQRRESCSGRSRLSAVSAHPRIAYSSTGRLSSRRNSQAWPGARRRRCIRGWRLRTYSLIKALALTTREASIRSLRSLSHYRRRKSRVDKREAWVPMTASKRWSRRNQSTWIRSTGSLHRVSCRSTTTSSGSRTTSSRSPASTATWCTTWTSLALWPQESS